MKLSFSVPVPITVVQGLAFHLFYAESLTKMGLELRWIFVFIRENNKGWGDDSAVKG